MLGARWRVAMLVFRQAQEKDPWRLRTAVKTWTILLTAQCSVQYTEERALHNTLCTDSIVQYAPVQADLSSSGVLRCGVVCTVPPQCSCVGEDERASLRPLLLLLLL